MRCHIRKRGYRSWTIVIDLDRDANGKRLQKWDTVKGTKRDAERKAAEIVQQTLHWVHGGQGLVFTRSNGQPMLPGTVSHTFVKIARKAGFPHLWLHDLRHTHATLVLQRGVHLKVVQERLGHATISTISDIYSHVLPGIQEAAAARFDDEISGV